MAHHQVIARKWRPQDFAALVGQTHVSQTLMNALRADRMPQALLFTGPRGTGKTSSARILAKSIRCPKAKNFVPCNTCEICEEITSGRAVDVIEIDGASNNGVDAIRELRETVGYMPSSGKYKVYIIDEVHMLSGSAFNALLKTLEEPPPHVVFVLATTEVQKIPNTILSRCQRFDFRRIPARLISDHLKQICQKEKIAFEPEALWLIARQGDGSMRDSQSLLEQVISFADGKITSAKVVEVLGLTDRALLLQTLSALIARDQKGIVEVIEKLFLSGADPAVFSQDLVEEVRHLMLAKVIAENANSAIDLSDEEIQHLKELGQKLSTEDIHLLFDMALKGVNDLLSSQDTRVVLEMLLLRMAVAPRVVEISQMSWGPTTAPAASAPAPVKAAKPAEAPTSSNKWLEFVQQLKGVNPIIGAKLDHVQFVALKDTKLELQIPEKFKFLTGQLDTDDIKKKLKNYTKTFWGKACDIEFIGEGSGKAFSAHQMSEQKTADEKQRIRDEVENHPLVKTAKDLFNSEITSIKERS